MGSRSMAANSARSHDHDTADRSDADHSFADIPTPDYDVPGIVDISELSAGDMVRMEDHATPLKVQAVASREIPLAGDRTTTQYAVAIEHDREDAVTHELKQEINSISGDVIELVDRDDETPVRLFKAEQ